MLKHNPWTLLPFVKADDQPEHSQMTVTVFGRLCVTLIIASHCVSQVLFFKLLPLTRSQCSSQQAVNSKVQFYFNIIVYQC